MRALVLILALVSTEGFAHARFRPHTVDADGKRTFTSNTPPRNDSTGLKTGPCGDVPRTTTPSVYKPGQEIEVQWEETINHPGYFTISFSKDGDLDFDKTILVPKYEDTLNDPLTNGATHTYSTKVTLPNETCENCTLQLIQVMTEDPLNPKLYYSCSDIRLTNEEKPKDMTPDTGTDTPTKEPTGTKPGKPTGVKVKKN